MTEAVFEETSASNRLAGLPLAHLSIELGHLYMEDLDADPSHLGRMMQAVAPWVQTAQRLCSENLRPATARISTCFLVDDYFTQLIAPRELVPQIVEAAAMAGLQVDYLVRESACAVADGVELATLVLDRVVQDPPPRTNGSRPPLSETGWLCNGERSPSHELSEAMRTPSWRPPSENGANRHSVFADVQLWEERPNGRQWSCPYLASIWQLLRLGVLRDNGEPVLQPRRWHDPRYPMSWDQMPPITQISERPAAFSAYRAYSVLPLRYFAIENAVRVILSQVDIGQDVRHQMMNRAAGERPAAVFLPPELVDRVEYNFVGSPWLA